MPPEKGIGNTVEGNTSSGKGSLLQFKITLKGIRPPIWRRFLVPEGISLSDLHDVIQEVMGWWNSHLHEFRFKGRRYGVCDPELDMEGVIDEGTVTIKDLGLSPRGKIVYEYDFGDGWEHELLLEKILPAEGRMSPVCLKGARSCPPEDCGGAWGYENLQKILKDPEDEEYASWKEWLPEDFDPEHFDLDSVNTILSSRKWTTLPSHKRRKKTV
ncbi:MAG: plasmid pRiA4b ORF-3 family protein [Leptospirillia bacterium]